VLPIRVILHPTDFSDRAGNAFHLACALARDYRARLIVLHVAEPTFLYGEGFLPPDSEATSQEAWENLSRLQSPDNSVRVERRFESGDPATEILRLAQEVGADLIVMGTHGRTWLGRLFRDSVAEQVLRHAICPVLTMTMPFPEKTPVEAPVQGTATA
jgi:nucleotide-binding universal stress UspA family protein